MAAVEDDNITIEDGTRIVKAPTPTGHKAASSLAGLIDQLGPSQTDLTPEQIKENERRVQERLARESAESAQFLSGERTLGPAWVDPDADVDPHRGPGLAFEPTEEERERVEAIRAAAAVDLEAGEGITSPPHSSDAGISDEADLGL